MRKTVSAALCAFVLAGCATQQRMVWTRPGSTQQEFYMENGQCRAQAFSGTGVPLMQAVVIFESCMQGKGWYKVPAQS